MEQKKVWTILIYANGNNELQPEMWQSKIAAESAGFHPDVNVILQVSREKDALVGIIRPSYSLPPCNVKWIGARRYLLDNGKSILLKDLGKINMASPKSLYEFIKWATVYYPADNYMLILSGHGYQFVGAITDYSQNAPFIMGIPEMCSAIQSSCEELRLKIELLVFDICYFNSIEVMYELGKEEFPAVTNVLTYLRNGPIAGIPLDEFIHTIQANCHSNSRELINQLTQITSNKNYTLVATEINHIKLRYIKELFNNLASCYLDANSSLNLVELLYYSNPACFWHSLVSEINSTISSLAISYTNNCDSNARLLFVASVPTSNHNKLALYSKLAFAHNNTWTHLLSTKKDYTPPKTNYSNELNPTMLTLDEVLTYISIMNPPLPFDQKQVILEKLINYKKWGHIQTLQPCSKRP